jgi:hypothetical protein
MSGSDPATFRYVGPDGKTIATGPLSLLNDQLAAQRTAEGAIRAAALTVDESHRARADALDQRERAIQAREDAAMAAKLQALKDEFFAKADALVRRMDAAEQRQLAAEFKAADEALAALTDHGGLEIKQAPDLLDEDEIETRGGAASATTAINQSDDLLDGGSPSLPQREPEPYVPVEPMGALNDAADLQRFGRAFLCARDRRAYMKAMRI